MKKSSLKLLSLFFLLNFFLVARSLTQTTQSPDKGVQSNSDEGDPSGSIPELGPAPLDESYQVFETSTDYNYEPVGKRDPFRPFRDAKVGIGQIRIATRTPEPLEQYDLKALEIVAIVWDNAKPKALIQDPDKGIHSVVKGQRIGKNEGYIAEIREGEIVVVELFDLNGKIIKEPFVMCIDKSKGCGS